jgi:hypothetical protein
MERIEVMSACCKAPAKTTRHADALDEVQVTTCEKCGHECQTLEVNPETDAVMMVESAEENEHND